MKIRLRQLTLMKHLTCLRTFLASLNSANAFKYWNLLTSVTAHEAPSGTRSTSWKSSTGVLRQMQIKKKKVSCGSRQYLNYMISEPMFIWWTRSWGSHLYQFPVVRVFLVDKFQLKVLDVVLEHISEIWVGKFANIRMVSSFAEEKVTCYPQLTLFSRSTVRDHLFWNDGMSLDGQASERGTIYAERNVTLVHEELETTKNAMRVNDMNMKPKRKLGFHFLPPLSLPLPFRLPCEVGFHRQPVLVTKSWFVNALRHNTTGEFQSLQCVTCGWFWRIRQNQTLRSAIRKEET